jgi:hypothetical protein
MQKRKRTIKKEHKHQQRPTETSTTTDTTEKKIKAEESSGYQSSSSGISSSEESEDEMPLAKLSKKSTGFGLPMRDLPMSGMDGMEMRERYEMAGAAQVEREQAELRAVIPTGRVVFNGSEFGGSWEGNRIEGGFWSQRCEMGVDQRAEIVVEDNKPRKSV